ncbi:phage tail length tape measure family protein [Jannaschia sp. KMU-145]|uniref:phage tail length tape measure family protein n=1 Tax=Jannaschia halovivens TaxID=3388667 RepID=UPI00396AF8C2
MSNKRYSLELNIDAAAAKRGSDQFRAAIEAVKRSVTGLERDTEGLFAKLSKSKINIDSRSIKDASTSFKAAKNAALASGDAIRRTAIQQATALRVSTTETQRLAERLDRLGDMGSVAKLNAELARLKTNLAAAQSPLDVREARASFLTGRDDLKRRAVDLEAMARAETVAAAATASRATEIERLRAAYNPLYATSQRYETALNEIAQAERLGAISAKQAGAARAEAAAQLAGASAQMKRYGNATRVAGHQSQNAAYQIQDVFVTAEMGMSPMRIALQQGSQLSMVINDMARESGGARGALTGLVSGIGSMINPMSLATIGVIAGAAALIQWGMGALNAEDSAASLEDRLDNLRVLMEGVSASQDILALSTLELVNKYGDAAGAVREFAILQAQLRVAEVNNALREQSSIMRDAAAGYHTAASGGHDLRNTLQRLSSDFGVTAADARQLNDIIGRLANSNTMDAQAAAVSDLNRFLLDAGVAASNLPPEFSASLIETIDLHNEVRAAEAAANDLANTVADVAPSLSPAVDVAANLTSELQAAMNLMSRINQQESQVYSGRGGDPRDFENGPQYNRELGYTPVQDMIDAHNERAAARTRKGSRGGGGGRSRRAAISEEAKAIERLNGQIQDRLENLRHEEAAHRLVAAGQFESLRAAELYAQKASQNGGLVDAETAAILRQIDALEVQSEARRGNSNGLRDGIEGAARDGIAAALNGDPEAFANFANNIRSAVTNALADRIVEGLGIGDALDSMLGGFGGGSEAAALTNGVVTGGQQAGATIASQMVSAAQQAANVLAGGVSRGGSLGASQMQTATAAGGARMSTMVTVASTRGASQMQTGIVQGSSQGAQMMARATAGGGGLGGFLGGGNWLTLGLMAGSMLFAGSGSDAAPAPVAYREPAPKVSEFHGIPEFARGTANTSGMPAILHANEAVIPLDGNRKVPVSLAGGGGGDMVVNNHVAVTVEGNGGDDEAQGAQIAEVITNQINGMIEQKMVEHMRYGGLMNTRG